MGASVSISPDLPETLSEAQVQKICGDQYNPQYFQALRQEHNQVSTKDLVNLIKSKIEREVLSLYFGYCPTGRMKNSAFFAMCRECKLLAKADFSIRKAEKLFDTVLSKTETIETRTISYRAFRYHALPDLAPMKGWTLEKVLKRLSECETIIEDKNEVRKARMDVRVSSNVEELENIAKEDDVLKGVEKSIDLSSMINASHKNAVLKIQTASRQKSSKKEANRLRELRRVESGEVDVAVKEEDKPDEGDKSEIMLKSYFYKMVGPEGEMSAKEFCDFMRRGNVLDKELTTIDCSFIFKKARATASLPGNAFNDCVVHNKRLMYSAVRILAMPQAALFKGLPTSKFIQALATGLLKSEVSMTTVKNASDHSTPTIIE